ncbi:hypothetical protein PTTG_05651 [Puccinia triticina 1-1 BBBD Race 1]|uniref:MAT1 domain-containing protein n=1 Tax=Puccinia triticina (isolate 1-1 / race 1 (BBBD)) TaxID=630390 RepID=A0A0C4EXV2_PUCT1|nr:hypothetical protein PTTG_05651 [Puccinia triticina 1-1 BBBD Race 1]
MIAFNLINGVDVAETEAKIKQFQIENQELIAQNAVHEARQAELSKRQEEAVRKEREERTELLRLEEEARREEEEIKRATIHSLLAVIDVPMSFSGDLERKRREACGETTGSCTKASDRPSISLRPSDEGDGGDAIVERVDRSKLDGVCGCEPPGHRGSSDTGDIDHDSMRLVLADHALALVGGFEIESVWEPSFVAP